MNRRSRLAARKSALFAFAEAHTYVLPTLTSRSPTTLPVTGGTVTLVGTGFLTLRSVKLGNVLGTATVTDDSHMTVVFGSLAAGVQYLYVNTGGGQAVPLSVSCYPVVSSNTPAVGSAAGGTSVVITGQGFTGATSVLFGSTPAASFVVNSDTQITAVTPDHELGAVSISVVGPGGTGTRSNAFTFQLSGALNIVSVTPDHGPVAGGSSHTIAGSGFHRTSMDVVISNVSVNTFGGSFVVVSDSVITFVAPASWDGAGAKDIDVTDGIDTDTLVGGFTFDP